MQAGETKFHIAIPSNDILKSVKYYTALGCKIGRVNAQQGIIDFFGAQLVVHLSKEKQKAEMYPRHFGVILNDYDYEELLDFIHKSEIPFKEPPFRRNDGHTSDHKSFFLVDPSNNMIEFKTYVFDRMI